MTVSRYKPEGWTTITPRLFTHDIQGLVDFLKRVFGAQGEVHAGRPAEMTMDDSRILISDGAGLRTASPAFLYVYMSAIPMKRIEGRSKQVRGQSRRPRARLTAIVAPR